MTQQIQHRMSNPMGQWGTLALLAAGGFLVYWYIADQAKKKREGDGAKPEAQVIPPSAWSADQNQAVPRMEVEAGQLYKAVFTTPLVDGEIPAYRASYLPDIAFQVLEFTQEMLYEGDVPVGAQGTISFIPTFVGAVEGHANIVVDNGQEGDETLGSLVRILPLQVTE